MHTQEEQLPQDCFYKAIGVESTMITHLTFLNLRNYQLGKVLNFKRP